METTALLLVDLQNDFMPTGALPVPHGDEVATLANELMKNNGYDFIIASQDWHPANHYSFKKLWPAHCVQHSFGAELVKSLHTDKIHKIIQKGTHTDIDSYSVFFDNDHIHQTDLRRYLQQNHVAHLTIMGLATDYCVKFSVLDALQLGYKVTVIKNGCRGINLKPDDVENAFLEMAQHGATLV